MANTSQADITGYSKAAFQKFVKDQPVSYGYVATPVGDICLAEYNRHIIWLSFVNTPNAYSPAKLLDFIPLAKFTQDDAVAKRFSQDYFQDNKRRFPLLLVGTAFQQKIWKALLTVPEGQTITYGGLANLAGYPGAARAVGQAMNKNNIGLVVPCHRVLAHGGKIGGYAGGLDRKKKLLKWEVERMCSTKAA